MKKILVIEDELNIRELITEMLIDNGFNVSGACSGEEGLKIFNEESADLIICDIRMPHMNGFQVLSKLRKIPKNINIPFIFLTGMTEREEFRKGMELGADDFITKPFTENELISAVSGRLKRAELLKSQIFPVNSTSYTKDDFKEIDLPKKLALDDTLFLSVDNKPRLIKVSSIKCISALGDYSHLFFIDGEKLIIRKSMKEWEDVLPAKPFVRIHRSTIINLDFVEKIEKWFNRAFKVTIKGVTKPFIISRRFGSKLRHSF